MPLIGVSLIAPSLIRSGFGILKCFWRNPTKAGSLAPVEDFAAFADGFSAEAILGATTMLTAITKRCIAEIPDAIRRPPRSINVAKGRLPFGRIRLFKFA